MPLTLTIEFETASHHGNGLGLAGIVDRALLRDQDGMPYLAGSALKGKFRYVGLLILRAGPEAALYPRHAEHACSSAEACILCRIFGSRGQPGAAIFNNAFPMDHEKRLIESLAGISSSTFLSGGSEIRTSTAIDRARRTVLAEHLFSTEILPSFIRFRCDIGGALTPEQVEFLTRCAKLLNCFGGGSARGAGICRFVPIPDPEAA